jgi:hypothetical protein
MSDNKKERQPASPPSSVFFGPAELKRKKNIFERHFMALKETLPTGRRYRRLNQLIEKGLTETIWMDPKITYYPQLTGIFNRLAPYGSSEYLQLFSSAMLNYKKISLEDLSIIAQKFLPAAIKHYECALTSLELEKSARLYNAVRILFCFVIHYLKKYPQNSEGFNKRQTSVFPSDFYIPPVHPLLLDNPKASAILEEAEGTDILLNLARAINKGGGVELKYYLNKFILTGHDVTELAKYLNLITQHPDHLSIDGNEKYSFYPNEIKIFKQSENFAKANIFADQKKYNRDIIQALLPNYEEKLLPSFFPKLVLTIMLNYLYDDARKEYSQSLDGDNNQDADEDLEPTCTNIWIRK